MTAEVAAAAAILAVLAVFGGTFAARLLAGASGGVVEPPRDDPE